LVFCSAMTLSVLLVEDVPELRSVLRQSLRLRGGFQVVAEADDGAAAIAAAARHQPDVVVLDLGLPDLLGHEVLTRLRVVSPASQVVVYTGSISPDRTQLSEVVEAFVTKDHDVSYLVDLLGRLVRPRYESAAVEIGPETTDVAIARRFLTERCRNWGCDDLIEDAELVVSELVTNALVHGGGRCELRAGLSDAALRLQVIDFGGGMPDPLAAGQADEHGRGLLLISALCEAWGVEVLPGGGKVVWAEMLRRLPDPGGDPFDRSSAHITGALDQPASAGADQAATGSAGTPPSDATASAVASVR
jgi:CheY-like chemotaxis protein/anti-sigma regulatory factor (Ser/Thr protein kinase)